jgi:WD40 repeat protein
MIYLVWKYKHNRPWRTYKHKHPVSSVAISEDMTLSGDIEGKIKVWHNPTGTLIKVIE